MASSPPDTPRIQLQNRVRAISLHVPWYASKGIRRLAADCQVHRSTIHRLIRYQTTPSHLLAQSLIDSLSKRLGIAISSREVFSVDGSYPTPRVCDLVGCPGCLPPEAYDEEGNLRPDFNNMRPGDWCDARIDTTYQPNSY